MFCATMRLIPEYCSGQDIMAGETWAQDVALARLALPIALCCIQNDKGFPGTPDRSREEKIKKKTLLIGGRLGPYEVWRPGCCSKACTMRCKHLCDGEIVGRQQ